MEQVTWRLRVEQKKPWDYLSLPRELSLPAAPAKVPDMGAVWDIPDDLSPSQ